MQQKTKAEDTVRAEVTFTLGETEHTGAGLGIADFLQIKRNLRQQRIADTMASLETGTNHIVTAIAISQANGIMADMEAIMALSISAEGALEAVYFSLRGAGNQLSRNEIMDRASGIGELTEAGEKIVQASRFLREAQEADKGADPQMTSPQTGQAPPPSSSGTTDET